MDNPIHKIKLFAKRLGIDPQQLGDLPEVAINTYNCTPGALHWTMRLHHVNKKGMTLAFNAKLAKLLTPYYRDLMKQGRIIVPAEVWSACQRIWCCLRSS